MSIVKISKKSINRIIVLIISLLLVILIPKRNYIFVAIQLIVVTANMIPIIIDSFKNRAFVFFSFISFTYETLFLITLFRFILKIPETSWRRGFSFSPSCEVALFYIDISLILLGFFYWVGLSGCKKKMEYTGTQYQLNVKGYFLFAILTIIYAIFFIYRGGFLSLRTYEYDGSVLLMSLYRIIQAALVTASYCINYQKKSIIVRIVRVLSLSVYMLLDVVMGILGYRYILVEIVLFIAYLNLDKIKRIKAKTIIIICISAIISYFLLTYIRIRSTGGVNGIESFFRHERNIFYSLVAIIDTRPTDGLNTYYNTMMNLLPKLITHSTADNTGRVLIRYIYSTLYNTSKLTMGGFYLTEAYYNYRFWGVIGATCVFGLMIVLAETKINRECLKGYLMYFFIAAQTYNIVYYGSSNFVKIILYYFIFVCAFEKMGIRKKINT